MSDKTKIKWTDCTWNPVIGCSPVSAGCKNCYAKNQTFARVMRSKGVELFGGNKRWIASESTWRAPYRWAKNPWVCDTCGMDWKEKPFACCGTAEFHRRRVFLGSMMDWLDDVIPVESLAMMLKTIQETPEIDWLLLTKRPENFLSRVESASHQFDMESDMYNFCFGWMVGQCAPKNVWIGTTVENQEMADKRIPELLKIPAAVRFLSCEPLLGGIDFYATGKGLVEKLGGHQNYPVEPIKWVIVGGESGHNARPCNIDWIRSIVQQCKSAGVACFVKQLGDNWLVPSGELNGVKVALKHSPKRGWSKKGADPSKWPEDLRVQQFPNTWR